MLKAPRLSRPSQDQGDLDRVWNDCDFGSSSGITESNSWNPEAKNEIKLAVHLLHNTLGSAMQIG